MILGIRTDTATAVLVLYDSQKEIARHSWEAGRELSSQLVNEIQKLLHKNGGDFQNLSGVVVFRGPGSFTGLRIGVTVANTSAYSQNIPIVGAKGDEWMAKGIEKLLSRQDDHQILPEYGAPPNTTKPR